MAINTHDIIENTTVGIFLAQWKLDNFNAQNFIDLEISPDITNLDRIKSKYTTEDLSVLNKSVPSSILIKAGTQVGIPNNVILRRTGAPLVLPDLIQLTEFEPFIAAKLRDLLNDPKYFSDIRTNDDQNAGRVDVNDLSVFAWIRSISDPGTTDQQGSWYNISAFVETLSTVVNKGVGSFAMTLSPAVGRFNKESGWHISDRLFGSGSVREDIFTQSVISKYKNQGDNFLSREDHFFNRVFQENDLIYIRFEKLAAEKERDISDGVGDDGESFGNNIPGNIYDMIGLVDAVPVNTTEISVSTQVQGRDLMKLFIEDGSYFFPEQFAQQIFTDPNSILTKRNRIELTAQSLLSVGYSFKSIATVLKFIFNKFSNMGMVPDSVFNGYGDTIQRKKYSLQSSSLIANANNEVITEVNNIFAQEKRKGVWQIIDLVFDKNAALRVMADNSIATDNGSIISSMRKVCQEPFVEIYGDTYGDRYNVIVRRPPTDEKGYKGLVYGSTISETASDGVNVNSLEDESQLKTGFPISSSDKNDQKKEILSKAAQRKLNGRPSEISSLVIDIDEADVISENLVYDDEVYSWYRLIPRGLGVQDDSSSFLLAPVIPLDEYAEIWGSKQLTIEYNYSPVQFIDDSLLTKSLKYAEAQTFLDLQYLLQSYTPLPFTRKGTIRINGDRRIKRGMSIYYKPTDEIFQVEQVGNARTLQDRTTALTVRRGMKEKYIKGVMVDFGGGNKKLVSYFKIVPTVLPNDASINNRDFLKNWRVDKDIFNFFIQRRQWVDNNIG